MRRTAVVMACGAVLGTAPAEAATSEVQAAGNVVTGGLAFVPDAVTIGLGDTVRWTNTDFFAPHTSTEDHGLWDLGGAWGATPLNPSGYAPGASVERVFEAGVHKYFCRVHPVEMRATVSVAPIASLATERRRVRTRSGRRITRVRHVVTARWASDAPADGLAFDVQRRSGGGEWIPWLTDTREVEARLLARRGRLVEIRARLRKAGGDGPATEWSPAVAVTAR